MSETSQNLGAARAAPAEITQQPSIGAIEPVLALGVFFLLVLGVLAWNQSHGTMLAVWPAGGVLFGYLLIRPQCPAVKLLGAGLVLDLVARLLLGESFLMALLLGAINIGEVAFVMILTRRDSARTGAGLQRTSELAHRLMPACLAASLAGATLATIAGFFAPEAPATTLPGLLASAAGLWAARFLGLATAGILTMELLHPKLATSKRRTRHLVVLACTVLVCAAAAWAVFAQTQQPLLYLLAVLSVFTGYFTGLRGASAGILVMSVVASWFTAHGSGPLALMPGAGLEERMLGLQVFAVVGGSTVLLFTSALTAFGRERVTSQRNLAKMMAVMASSPVGICFTRNDRFELVSTSFEAMFGHPAGSMAGLTPIVICESSAFCEGLRTRSRAASRLGQPFSEEVRFRRRDDTRFWGKLQIAPVHSGDASLGAIWTVEDITEARELRERLSWSATHDPLTDLVNRREFEARLADWLGKRRPGQTASGLFIDLDRFKAVNDIAGHGAGDQMLKDVAAIMLAAVRQGDTVARMGGDEFAILLPGCTPEFAGQVAEKLRTSVQAHVLLWKDEPLRIGASVGLVEIDASFTDVASVVAAADQACYAAKNAGRNSVIQA
jgi:diguanylate cyclase (GGDEF)-like protein/PAS domain S-box-containing protein